LKLDGPGALVRQQGHALDGIGQPIPLEFNVLVVGLGNDALVRRKLAIDHSRDQSSLTDIKEEVVLALLKSNLVVSFRKEPAKLTQRLLGQDRPFFLTLLGGLEFRAIVPVIAPVSGNSNECETMSVSCHQTH